MKAVGFRKSLPITEAESLVDFDAAGVVKSVGKEATLFKPGDEVFYADSNIRPGANAQLHAVDERIVGKKPKTLSFAQAAALPLTSITAWELMFTRSTFTTPDIQAQHDLLCEVSALIESGTTIGKNVLEGL